MALILVLAGCTADDFESDLDFISFFDFQNGLQNWEAGVSNYNYSQRDSLDFNLAHQTYLHDGVTKQTMNLEVKKLPMQSFVFIHNSIKGLQPDTKYEITFEIKHRYQFNSLVETSDDGSVGEMKYRCGISSMKPEVWVQEGTQPERMMLNIDMTNSSSDYTSIYLSKKPLSHNDSFVTLDNFLKPLVVQTNGDGGFWFLLGHTITESFNYSIIFDSIIIYYSEI